MTEKVRLNWDTTEQDMQTHERGIALILSMFLMTAMSVLAASLMFLSQTETYASMNYRMMSQARYAGEAAVQRATNFLLDSTQYALPTVAELAADYNFDVSPVTRKSNGQPVVLSATTAVASNYPVAAMVTAFNTAAKGTLTAGNTDISFNAYATLVTMQSFESYGGGQAIVQTWEITGVGALGGSRNATVEVLATIETPKTLANSFAAFATDNGCAALQFKGNAETKSYSTVGLTGSTAPTLLDSGGDVGTNGNLDVTNHVDVNGNLYTPRTGVGACNNNNVTALTGLETTVSGSRVKLPTALVFPTPPIPNPSPLAEVKNSDLPGTSATTCALFGLTPGTSAEVAAGTKQCNVTGSTVTLNGNGSTLSLPGISPSAHVDFVLVASPTAAQYNFNSIHLSGGASIGVSAKALNESVVVNVVGKNPDGSAIATPIDFQGGSTYAAADLTGCAGCSVYDAAMLQFIYGGSGQVKFAGNSNGSAVLYAPNAAATLVGNSVIYGSVLGKTIDDGGGANIYYDSSLQDKFFVAGNPIIGTFTWKRY